MLPSKQIFFWQQLLTLLSNLPKTETANLKVTLQQAIEIFEGEILPQDLETALSPPTAAKTRSYVTEIHRLLRLLQIDVLFLQASRHAHTSQQRYDTYRERLNNAIAFCQAAIKQLTVDS
jgi:hypothetical protein